MGFLKELSCLMRWTTVSSPRPDQLCIYMNFKVKKKKQIMKCMSFWKGKMFLYEIFSSTILFAYMPNRFFCIVNSWHLFLFPFIYVASHWFITSSFYLEDAYLSSWSFNISIVCQLCFIFCCDMPTIVLRINYRYR